MSAGWPGEACSTTTPSSSDPAKQFGGNNLSISYVIDNGLWDRETRMRLGMLKSKLDASASLLRETRNKLMAHTDLAAVLAGRTLGQFPVGADVEYLQELADLIAGEPRPFNDLVRNDPGLFVEALLRGARPTTF
jgi:hypothetical protein